MGWSGRRTESELDPWLPMLEAGRALRFVALAREVFAEHGLETTYSAGCLHGSDGQVFGLTNLAHQVTETRSRHWHRLVCEHVEGLLAAHATPKERDLDKVRARLFLRLWASEDLPQSPPAHLPFGDGLGALVSIDHPLHVESLTRAEDVEDLGGWPVLAPVACANLARLRADQAWEESSAEGRGLVLGSLGGFFNASRVLTMPALLRQDFLVEAPRDGVLFVVPNRSLVLVHPVEDRRAAAAAAQVLRAVAGVEHEMAGGISDQVWHWRSGGVRPFDAAS